MPLHNKNKAFKILLLSCSISIAGKALSNDSLYVKFIHKKIGSTKNVFYSTLKVKKNLYLFCQDRDDTIINCFEFKKNALISSGRLTVQKTSIALFVAKRSGYWKFFDAKKKTRRVYFDDDEPLKEEELPIEESDNVLYKKD